MAVVLLLLLLSLLLLLLPVAFVVAVVVALPVMQLLLSVVYTIVVAPAINVVADHVADLAFGECVAAIAMDTTTAIITTARTNKQLQQLRQQPKQ